MRRLAFALTICAACSGHAAAAAEQTRCEGGGDPQIAIAACTRLIESGTLNNEALAVAFFNRAANHQDKGDLPSALVDYEKAARIKPGFADAHYNRGIILDEMGELSKAVAEYTKAIDIERDYAFLTNRGTAYLSLRDFDRAIADLTEAVGLRPTDSGSYFRRGNAYADKGNVDAAVRDFTKATALAPDEASRTAYTARLYHAQGLTRRAMDAYRAALARDDLDDAGRKMIETYMNKLNQP